MSTVADGNIYAGVAELADALDSGSNGRKAVQVQVLSPAPNKSTHLLVGAFFLRKSDNKEKGTLTGAFC